MNVDAKRARRAGIRRTARRTANLSLLIGLISGASATYAQTAAGIVDPADPRIGLGAGLFDAEEAARGMERLASHRPPADFVNPNSATGASLSNTDLAFQGDLAIMGNYHGFQIYDISDPADPVLRSSLVCPGGQGDVSIHGNLLFMSVEETRARIDCGTQGTTGQVDPERFLGVRIFDLTDLANPTQVAAVQTCRGSHTHTLVSDPNDPDHVYVYVSGTGGARPDAELEGCVAAHWANDPSTSYWRIEVIQVLLAAPQEARVVSAPRVFADPVSGALGALWDGGDHGPGTQRSAQTNACHDITVYPAIGLAAGACSGNGILIDISDPANPVRIDEVVDPNFAYWHSATFSNDGRKVIFTDEWGGGGSPRCRASDPREWGANAIFDLVDGELRFASYYKLPAPQTESENCVAHNGSLVPVPGRDLKVQAWYQGGISVFDFTDSANPFEVAFFDLGPVSTTGRGFGGYWSSYWYNGYIYGSEIVRGFDVFRLTPSEHLTQNEIDAANLVRFEEFNPQHQPRVTWPAAFVVARAYLDQLARGAGVAEDRLAHFAAELDRAEAMPEGAQRTAALQGIAAQVIAEEGAAVTAARTADANRLQLLTEVLTELAGGAN